MRLHTKVLLVVIPLAVIPLLILGWLAYAQLRSTAIERSSNEMTNLMDQMSRNFKIHQDVATANVKLFADASLMRAYALTEDEEDRYVLMLPSLLKLFSSYLRAYPHYSEIRYLLPDGYEDARSTLTAITNNSEDEANTAFFNALSHFDGETMTYVSTPAEYETIALQVAKPIKLINLTTQDPLNSTPILRGYLVVTMQLDFMAKQIAAAKIGQSGYTFIVSPEGKVLMHQDPSQVGQSIAPELLSKATQMQGNQQLQPATYLSSNSLLSVRHLHDGLLLIGLLPEAELLEESQRLRQAISWVVVGSIVLIIATMLIAISILMLRPLKHLSLAVRELSYGNLMPHLPLSSKDELGQLAQSFQEMAGNLEKSRLKIERLAYHDSLTGLPNRFQAHQMLRHMIALAKRENNKMAVLFLDLDNFKRVNDTLGHQIGDQLLKETAIRLSSILRAEDIIHQENPRPSDDVLARLGGDEFVILLANIDNSIDVAKVASRIQENMKLPFQLDEREIYSTSSIGIALFPDDATEVDDLIKRAEAAMYQAKEQGRNNFQFYSASYNLAAFERISLEAKLRCALKNHELELYYQPLIQTNTAQVVGLEALLRWNDPAEGVISPERFIPIAEDSGLILPIGEWVLHEAGRQLSAWHAAQLTEASVSVNISTIQLQRQDFVSIVNQVLGDNGLNPSQLELEITETSLLKIKPEVIRNLDILHQRGMTISLDDFGTGYSSLSVLQELPIGKLKIDKSFVRDMLIEPKDAAIVSAVLFIAKTLGLRSTAEGVETLEQAKQLAKEGCDQLQGYLLCQPLPAQQMTEFLKSQQSSHSLKTILAID